MVLQTKVKIEDSSCSSALPLVRALPVQRTPQGSLIVGDHEVLIQRTGSGRLRRDDSSLLAQFFFADDALNMVATELDSFDGRKDPDRCATLVSQLRRAQDRVLNITSQIMDQILGDERVARGFRVKFPEDVLQDNLAGQLWFGAECLSAGSSIMNREEESAAMRPLAKALTRSLETVRFLLRERCLRPRGLALCQQIVADDMLQESLKIFDRLFAEFELCYVSAMVNVKTPHEFEAQQLICVLFSESLRRALKQNLLTQEQVDSYDPALMFAVPRLAIVSGLLIYSSGPLSIDKPPEEMSDMFRPFRTLLHKIRSLLWTLDRRELTALERLLATNGDVASFASLELPSASEIIDDPSCPYPDIGEFVSRFYADHANVRDLYTQPSSSEPNITDGDYLPDNIEVMTPILDGLRRLTEVSEDTETESEPTFQDRSRKTSRTEESKSDLSSLRNLSTNGLMMFDPLVINAMTASTSDANRQFPDHDLVTSLNEQVTEINDRLSSIAGNDVDIIDPLHSFSTSDVPTLIATEDDTYAFAGSRNDQITCLPSTSHGYLIPNAISHEPTVLSSLSHNNSTIFNAEDESDNAMTNSGMIMPDHPIDTDITTNINLSIANANLSSLLLTNEEYRENFETNDDNDDASFHSAKMTMEAPEVDDKVKFMLGYESDHDSPADSGVSTENTSLDRSPDVEKENFVENRVQSSEDTEISQPENMIEETLRLEPSSSLVSISSDEENQLSPKSNVEAKRNKKLEEEARKVFNGWGMPMPEEFRSIDDVISVLRKQRREKKISEQEKAEPKESTSQSQSSSRRKDPRRKSTSKNKRKKSKMFMVILESQNTQNQNSVRLDLDHFVDEGSAALDITECEDDEQIALALQAQELAARQQARGKFKSSEDLIHRLFVCIAGVADQLQTNFAADLRNILKAVFLMNQTPDEPDEPIEDKEKTPTIEYEVSEDQVIQNGSSFDSVYSAEEVYADSNSDSNQSEGSRLTRRNTVNSTTINEEPSPDVRTEVRRKSIDNVANLQASVSTGDLTLDREERRESTVERAPEWVPDIAAPACMRCEAHFTAFRRRHHCRNCGKVFCASCSSNSCPLPRYGQMKPVRVCEGCFASIALNCRRQTTR